MNTAQKFEEIMDMLGIAAVWLVEIDTDLTDPHRIAVDDMLYTISDMIRGKREWRTCSEIRERIENDYPEVKLCT